LINSYTSLKICTFSFEFDATLLLSPLSLNQSFENMKKSIFVILLMALVFSGFSQQIETRQVGSFRGVKSSQAIDVYLKKGVKEEVKVEVTSGKLSDVLTEVTGNNLRIHMRDGSYKRINVKVYVTYVNLERISASSASNIFSDGSIKTATMTINASSAGSVEVGLESESVVVDASSAGNIELNGKTKSLEAESSSAGDVDAYNLESEIVSAQASSGGSVKVSVSKELEGHASSGGSIKYRGNPTKTNTGSSSGGSVKKSN
jgi:Putative auto-transporter adhesin, head GIN domain